MRHTNVKVYRTTSVINSRRRPRMRIGEFHTNSNILMVLLMVTKRGNRGLFINLKEYPPINTMYEIVMRRNKGGVVRRGVRGSLSKRLRFRSTKHVRNRFPRNPFRSIGNSNIVNSFGRVATMNSNRSLFVFTKGAMSNCVRRPLAHLNRPFFGYDTIIF